MGQRARTDEVEGKYRASTPIQGRLAWWAETIALRSL
jgi:hypothetical protein